jgi:hypothetical protein
LSWDRGDARVIATLDDARRPMSPRSCLTILAALIFAGCMTVESVQDDPADNRREVSASGYTLAGCQSRMDELAGTKVQMTGHLSQVAISALNFGLAAPYKCSGIAPLPATSASTP